MNSVHALSLKLPAAAANVRVLRPSPAGDWTRWSVVVLFAAAMAWVESAVVFYLRTMVDRIQPYQADPLPVFGGLAGAELVREFATLVMLGTVGWLAGRTWRSRIGYALVAFGVWDICYYIFLRPLTGWPHSLLDWDILFLLPLPWWGPVLAPVLIAMLMIAGGTLISQFDRRGQAAWPGHITTILAAAGAILALYVFMADAIARLPGGADFVRNTLPDEFNWRLFLTALALMSAPVVEITVRLARREERGRSSLDYTKWITHFTRNRENRMEPDWTVPANIRSKALAPLVRSLEQFQLGDGGGPASLIAHDAERFRSQTTEMRTLVDFWFAEEREHARLLGCAVDRFGGRRITSHWSFTAFCQCRRALGVRFELQILLLTEIVSTAYYRVMRRHCEDPAVRAMCKRILRDEAGHISFHCDRLAAERRSSRGLPGSLWTAQFWLFGHAAATMLWINHGRCLTTLGGTRGEYYREVRRELRRFRLALERRQSGTCSTAGAPVELRLPLGSKAHEAFQQHVNTIQMI
jgi:hypothetical protein